MQQASVLCCMEMHPHLSSVHNEYSVDYIMITHPLKKNVRPALSTFHYKNGLIAYYRLIAQLRIYPYSLFLCIYI